MTAEELASALWVEPRYRAEVSFLEWTKGGFLRHAKVKRVATTWRTFIWMEREPWSG